MLYSPLHQKELSKEQEIELKEEEVDRLKTENAQITEDMKKIKRSLYKDVDYGGSYGNYHCPWDEEVPDYLKHKYRYF